MASFRRINELSPSYAMSSEAVEKIVPATYPSKSVLSLFDNSSLICNGVPIICPAAVISTRPCLKNSKAELKQQNSDSSNVNEGEKRSI